METNLTRYKKDLDRLIDEGHLLIAGLFNELDSPTYLREHILNVWDEVFIEQHSEMSFSDRYQIWYSEAYELIRQVLPSRLEDFASY